jgi:poly(3-hydroxybutyrate) depolymerase
LAAVAQSAFDLLAEDEEPCKPARAISVIAFRGTSDPIVPYTGGSSMPPRSHIQEDAKQGWEFMKKHPMP